MQNLITSRVGCWLLATIFSASLLITGCSPASRTVQFKINSEPEGAHVVYKVLGKSLPCNGEWIYLGDTPLRGVRQFNEDQVEGASKIILRVFHSGYHDQIKEWDGQGFWDEIQGRQGIFWTPELIPARP